MGSRAQVAALRIEVARWEAAYQQLTAVNAALQQQVLAQLGSQPAAVEIVREVMAGFKAVMAPDRPDPEPPVDVYGLAERTPVYTAGDPAWEIPDMLPDGLAEAEAREEAEDA